jgi:hypothetical protein
MPSCGALFSPPSGQSEIFGFDLNTDVGGSVTVTTNFESDPLEISIPLSLINKFPAVNLGLNDPIQSWYPVIWTWKWRSIKKKIRITRKKYINIFYEGYLPTQALNEFYLKPIKLPDIQLFTIPSFKFELGLTVGGSLTLKSRFSIILRGLEGLFLTMTTQKFIEDATQLAPGSFNQMTEKEQVELLTKLFAEAFIAGLIMKVKGEVLGERATANFIINELGGSAYIDISPFKLEFGDLLNINVPKFKMRFNVPDLLKDASGRSHPVAVEVGSDGVLKVKILLYTLNSNFFEDMIKGIRETLSDAENATKYDLVELEKILNIFVNSQNVVTQWLQRHLGLRSQYNFYFVFCPSGMAPDPENPHPPTPFFLLIETLIYFNPYKILATTLDFLQIYNKALRDLTAIIAHELNFIGSKEYKHTVDKTINSTQKLLSKEIKKNLRDIKKRLDNKLLNAERKIYAESFIPLVPP